MKKEKIKELKHFYYNELFENTLPFWTSRCVDNLKGGYLTYLDRSGNLMSTDKNGWVQGRMTWLFARIYNEYKREPEWLELAESGYRFLKDHIIDQDGRGWFQVTREGTPVRRRRYLFVETFAVIAFAEYYRATGDKEALDMALKVLELIYRLMADGTVPKFEPLVQTRGHSMTMIMISVLQNLRTCHPEGDYQSLIDTQINEIFRFFIHPEKKVLLETVGLNGEFINTPSGRTVNPGHAIETAWFIMTEAMERKNKELLDRILPVLDWHLEAGWDKEHGGLLSFIDCDGHQPEQVEWDMKFWWPHTEAIYACLLAWHLTGEDRYARWFEKIHQWSFAHFPDRENGEWYGYLHYDGTVASTVKGNFWKSAFHLPRQQLFTLQLLGKMEQEPVISL